MKAFRRAVEAQDLAALTALLAPDVEFRSPVSHKPYHGREVVGFILATVAQVFGDFRYIEELETGSVSMLRFVGAHRRSAGRGRRPHRAEWRWVDAAVDGDGATVVGAGGAGGGDGGALGAEGAVGRRRNGQSKQATGNRQPATGNGRSRNAGRIRGRNIG